MKVLAATLEKILLKREEEQFSRNNLGESRNFTCWKCGELGHISTTCESEKVLPIWRLSRNRSLARNNQRWSGNPQRRRKSNYTERENIWYVTEDPDSRDVIIQQKLYRVNMANDGITIRITVRVKGYPIKIIIDTEANVSIVIYPIVKRF